MTTIPIITLPSVEQIAAPPAQPEPQRSNEFWKKNQQVIISMAVRPQGAIIGGWGMGLAIRPEPVPPNPFIPFTPTPPKPPATMPPADD